jgi:hypothetical protein
VCVVWWISVAGSRQLYLRCVWVRMCVRWYAGRDGMGWVSLVWHGLLCGCCDGERACVAAAMARERVCVCVRACVRGCM